MSERQRDINCERAALLIYSDVEAARRTLKTTLYSVLPFPNDIIKLVVGYNRLTSEHAETIDKHKRARKLRRILNVRLNNPMAFKVDFIKNIYIFRLREGILHNIMAQGLPRDFPVPTDYWITKKELTGLKCLIREHTELSKNAMRPLSLIKNIPSYYLSFKEDMENKHQYPYFMTREKANILCEAIRKDIDNFAAGFIFREVIEYTGTSGKPVAIYRFVNEKYRYFVDTKTHPAKSAPTSRYIMKNFPQLLSETGKTCDLP